MLVEWCQSFLEELELPETRIDTVKGMEPACIAVLKGLLSGVSTSEMTAPSERMRSRGTNLTGALCWAEPRK